MENLYSLGPVPHLQVIELIIGLIICLHFLHEGGYFQGFSNKGSRIYGVIIK